MNFSHKQRFLIFFAFIVRVTYPQSSGLFTSREHEAEQKSQLLKHLAIVIFASEKDQYQKNMPEIQGKIEIGF